MLLLIFAFAGIEVALVPSGEVKNPARTVPRAIYISLAITTILYVLIQLVAQGILGGELANHPAAPLAEAATRFLGNAGRTLLLVGATISAFGFVTSDILSSPRVIFAFGRDGVLPAWFAHIHPRFRTPFFFRFWGGRVAGFFYFFFEGGEGGGEGSISNLFFYKKFCFFLTAPGGAYTLKGGGC